MTHALVERMVGHRTRLAQESPSSWHAGEDQELAAYLALSRRLDRTTAWLTALIPRGWLSWGCWGWRQRWWQAAARPSRWPSAWAGRCWPMKPVRKFAMGLGHLAGAMLAWHQVAPLFAAATRPQVVTPPAYAIPPGSPWTAGDVAPAGGACPGLSPSRTRGAGLAGVQSADEAGDRLLLEGPSGGGKSTLASLLTGLRQPESGLLLLGGLDLPDARDCGLAAAGGGRATIPRQPRLCRDLGLQPAHGPPLAAPSGGSAGRRRPCVAPWISGRSSTACRPGCCR